MLLNYAISSPNPVTSNNIEQPPLVLLHGVFGSLDNLGMIKKAQQEHTQVISIDLPNHGQSPHFDEFDYQLMSNKVLELLEHLNIKQCYLLGHSMGGKVAMHIALNAPQLVKKLIVADISPVKYQGNHDNVFKGLYAVDLANITTRKQADEQLAQHIIEPGVRAFLLKSLDLNEQQARWRFNLTAIKACYEQITLGITSSNSYGGPVLFIKGGNSQYIMPEHREIIGKLFPSSKAHVINDTGHWLHAEKPAVFNRIVARFLYEQ